VLAHGHQGAQALGEDDFKAIGVHKKPHITAPNRWGVYVRIVEAVGLDQS
jgi:hypothetical protein